MSPEYLNYDSTTNLSSVGEFRTVVHKQQVVKFGPDVNDLYFWNTTTGIITEISYDGIYVRPVELPPVKWHPSNRAFSDLPRDPEIRLSFAYDQITEII